jgi:hypothetical protein
MDIHCKGLEKDWGFTVGSEWMEVIEGSGGMNTIYSKTPI